MVVGINPGKVVRVVDPDSPALMRLFRKQTGVTFPLGYDTKKTYRVFGKRGEAISPFPLDIIVAPDGTIAYVSQKYEPRLIKEVIDRLARPD